MMKEQDIIKYDQAELRTKENYRTEKNVTIKLNKCNEMEKLKVENWRLPF